MFNIRDRDLGALASRSSSEWPSCMSSTAMGSGSAVIISLAINGGGISLPRIDFLRRRRCPGVDCDRFRGLSELPSVSSFVSNNLGVLEGT